MGNTKYQKKNGSNVHHKSDRLFAVSFTLPSIFFIVMVFIYPLFSAVIRSMKNGTLLSEGEFVGLQNYRALFQLGEFSSALQFSLLFALICVPCAYLVGLGIALLLNMDIPCRGFFRAALLVPWIVPSVVSVVCWRWMVIDRSSMINVILGWFNIGPIYFLSDKKWAVVTVCIVKIWKNFPFVAISLLAALQGIDMNVLEAAKIDGASTWQTFIKIKLPYLLPVSAVCMVLLTIWSYNDFDNLRMLTNGGPLGRTTNMMILAYNYAFTKNNLGMSCAMAMVSLVVIMFFSQFMLKMQEQE